MTKQCEGHGVWMEERHSKTKVEEDGSPKAYFGHSIGPGKMCFGIKKEDEVEDDRSYGQVDFDNEPPGDGTLPVAASKNKTVEDKPMTKLDWNEKEFIKGLGVFSSHARSEGMSPESAFKTMSIWEWMEVAYGDMPGYEEWKEKAKKRIK